MMPRLALPVLALSVFTIAGCSDDPIAPSPRRDLAKYVAIGTSVSMGWMSDGVLFSSQEQAWPNLLAEAAGVTFTQPLIANPGCKPPFAEPLSSFRRIDNTPATPSTVCAPLLAGSSPGSQDLAVENATAVEALNATPETATQGRGPVTSRVLPAGKTQVTAMRDLDPTFVSVEFGGNEVLPAQVGVLVPNVTYIPFATFQAAYAKIIDSVAATTSKALLVGLPSDIRQFPTIRTGAEIASQRAAFGTMNVTVNADCDASPNLIFVRGKVITAVVTGQQRSAAGLGPYDLSCADMPNTQDFVLTPGDVTFINNLLAQMNAEITAQANAHDFAMFSLESLYATSKDGVAFNLQTFLGSATPYGPKISLDGVHPSAEGHRILANAAIAALNQHYDYSLSSITP